MKSNRHKQRREYQPEGREKHIVFTPAEKKPATSGHADLEKKQSIQVPLKELLVLGQTRFSAPAAELKGSSFLSRMQAAADFSDIVYRPWDIKEFRSRLKQNLDRLRKAGTADEAARCLREVLDLWTEFKALGILAKLRAMEPGEEQAFYEEEYARAEQTAPLLEKSILKMASVILSKPWLNELGAVLGKPFLLHLNAYYTIYELGFRDLRREERELCARTIEQAEIFAHMGRHSKGLRQPDILLDDLLRLRNELGHKLGFDSYRDYAMSEQRLFDYEPGALRALRENIKRYFLPIHLHLNRELNKKIRAAERPGRQELPARGMFADDFTSGESLTDNIRDYYERFFGDEDWELRHISEMMPEPEEHEIGISGTASRLFRHGEAPELFFRQICEITDACLPRQQRGFLQLLGAKGYVRLNLKEPPEDFEVHLTGDNPCPILCGTYINNSDLIGDFLRLSGQAYAAVLAREAGTALFPDFAVSAESKMFHGLGMELLSWRHMDIIFQEQGEAYAKQRMLRLLRRLLKACLIDEFEEAIYRQEELSMSDRLDLWRHLRENYGMEYYTAEIFWADEDLREALLLNPFAALIRELPFVAALTLWDISNQRLKEAQTYYETICRLGGSDTFLQTLKEALLPDPFSKDNLKRLAYQIASFLES